MKINDWLLPFASFVCLAISVVFVLPVIKDWDSYRRGFPFGIALILLSIMIGGITLKAHKLSALVAYALILIGVGALALSFVIFYRSQ